MTTYLVCTCGHGLEAHGKEGCNTPVEGCFFEGKPIACSCNAWNPTKTNEPPKKRSADAFLGAALKRSGWLR